MATRRLKSFLVLSLLGFAACGRASGSDRAQDRDEVAPKIAGGMPFFPDELEPMPSPTPAPTPVTFPKVCHPLYDPDALPTFELEIESAVWQALVEDFAADRGVYRPAGFRFDGEDYPGVMVRYRGNNSRCGEKMQLAIAFNKVDPDGRFQGLRRLDLDHGSCRVLSERIAYEFAREAGVEAPCANNVRVMLNGEYYGLYANLEHVNRDFLKRNLEEHDGNLYKAGTRKNNEDDPDTSDYKDYKDAPDLEAVSAIIDLDQAVRMWAVEALLPAADNFWYYGRNYYLYHHPERGFLYIPNDYDHAVPLGWNMDYRPLPAREHPTDIVLADPAWRMRFLEELGVAHARFRPEWYAERIDRYWAQTREAIAADPFLQMEFDDAEIEKYKEVCRLRDQLIEDFLESEGYSHSSE